MPDDLTAKAGQVYVLLVERYGAQPLVPRREPLHELISTILSHRTTQHNEAVAYDRMWQKFGSWEAIRDAPPAQLAEAIAPSNFAEAKVPYIKGTLRQIIDERGAPNIDFLADLSADEGLAWLMALPGVGIKTASLTLLFCFSKPVLPVDTHVFRVSQRVGLIPLKANTEAAHHLLLALFPPDPYILFNFHIAALKHGQQLCIWGDNPRCQLCPLKDLCNWYQANRTGKVDQSAR